MRTAKYVSEIYKPLAFLLHFFQYLDSPAFPNSTQTSSKAGQKRLTVLTYKNALEFRCYAGGDVFMEFPVS
jgi:hypothetical protein